MNIFRYELLLILVPNGILWGMLLILPPVAVKVKTILGMRNARGLSFLNLIFITEDSIGRGEGYVNMVLKHEFTHLTQQRIFSPLGLAVILLIHYLWLFIRHRSVMAVYEHSFIECWANRKMYDQTPVPKEIIRINF
ncbi:MAG: hypothetical protein IT279_02435 [Ignavibacteriaceae bacterium]|nr:hypothetical protein [Ignavibacteriaceae bacterium]